jgi:hypothetical protein
MIPIRMDKAAVNNSISSLAFTVSCSAGMFSEYLMMEYFHVKYWPYFIEHMAAAG